MNDRAAYANANAALLPLADKSVHMIATSPPYWGLRSYDTGDQKHAELGAEPLHDCLAWARGDDPCGACYVCNMRTWAREMWRVLRDDGVMFLNLGDSYAGSGKGQMGNGAASDRRGAKQATSAGTLTGGLFTGAPSGLKPKDLVGIPWRVALALQADGWWLRQDIIWAKGNPMPESVQDRCSKSHEYVLLLTKNERYYFDSYAIRERSTSQAVSPLWSRSTPDGVLQEQPASRRIDGEMPLLHVGNQEGVGQKIQRQRESATDGQTLLLFRERAEGETGIPASLSTHTGTARALQGSTAGESVRPETQGANQEVLAKREGPGAEGNKGQAIRQNGGGPLLKAQDGNQAQASNQDLRLYTDEGGVAGDKGKVQSFVRVLRTEDGTARDGSCDSVVEGWETYGGEYSASLPEVQRIEGEQDTGTRNAKSVWHINTAPYSGSHFATWPPALVERMVKAGTSERGVCPECGKPWARIVEKGEPVNAPRNPNDALPYTANGSTNHGNGATTLHKVRESATVDWQPTCDHDAAPVPAIVLDPFCGSGTTLMVARQLGRVGLGFDLSLSYLRENARTRLGHDKLAAWGRGIVDTGDYSDLFRARANGNGAKVGLP